LAHVVAVALAALLPAGCSTVALHGSRIETVPDGATGRARGQAVTLEIEGLRLKAQPVDAVAVGRPLPPLRVRLVFEPAVIGYSFNPGDVRLRDAAGTEWKALVAGPGALEWDVCRGASGPVATGPGGFVTLWRGCCFEIQFDVATPPEGRLVLELDGLARGQRRLAPAKLQVAHATWSRVERMYWLEALGTALEVAGTAVMMAP
jgi:hypothetical protein